MTYDALTIDTQVIYSNDLDLQDGLVGQLVQYKDGLVDFLISEITVREVHKALTEKARSTNDALAKAIKSGAANGQISDADVALLKAFHDAMAQPQDHARKQIAEFLKNTGAEIVSASRAEVKEVLDRYFRNEPPFSSKGKKNEFPDAFALLSIEAWAREKNKRILAVSKDSDWKSFAEQSQLVDVVEDLGKAMALLNELADSMVPLARAVLTEVGNYDSATCELVDTLLEWSIANIFPYVDFDGPMPGELDSVSLELTGYEISGIEDQTTEIDVVRVGKESFAFRVPAHITANATADISFSVRDSIDNDYVPMGSTSVVREIEFDAFVLFDCSRLIGEGGSDDGGQSIVHSVEVVDAPKSIDFGYIDYSLAEDHYDFDIDTLYEEELAAKANEKQIDF